MRSLILWVLVVLPMAGWMLAEGFGCYSDYKESMRQGIPWLWIKPKD